MLTHMTFLRKTLITLLPLFFTPAVWATHVSEGKVPEETGLQVKVIADELFLPWAIDWLPDGNAILTEKRGTLRLLRDGQLSGPFDFPVEVTSGGSGGITRGQGGLMDVAVCPNYRRTGWIYFSFSSGDSKANRTELARARLEGEQLVDFEPLWRNPDDKRSGQHFGSRILFLPDNTLLLSIGDGGNPPVSLDGDDIRKQAQNPGTAFGKVFRLNPDGSIPGDNPSFQGSAIPGLWTYGHRNIQGIHRDPETGDIWANEHGAFRGDELNLLQPGQNFGWPAATYSRNYGTRSKISRVTELEGTIDPQLVWMSTHAPSGLRVYRGTEFPEWNGAILSGGLITRDVRVIQHAHHPDKIKESSIPIGKRVRDVRLGPDGGLYVLTDSQSGQLLRILPK